MAAHTVILKIHRGRDVRVKNPSVKGAAVVLEEVWDVDAIVDPRLDRVITLDVRHVRVPCVGELMKIPTAKGLGIAKPQTLKIRQRRARQNVIRTRELVQTRRRGGIPLEVDPRTRRFIHNHRGRVKIVRYQRRARGAQTKIALEVLRGKPGQPALKSARTTQARLSHTGTSSQRMRRAQGAQLAESHEGLQTSGASPVTRRT